MNPETQEMLRTVQDKVSELVACCDKKGSLYQRDPKKVAQVSRTGKWLLNAIAALRETLKEEPEGEK